MFLHEGTLNPLGPYICMSTNSHSNLGTALCNGQSILHWQRHLTVPHLWREQRFLFWFIHGAYCLLHYSAVCNKDYHPYVDCTTLICICGGGSVTLKLTYAYIHVHSYTEYTYVRNYFMPLPLSSATLAASVKDRSMVAMSFSQCLSNLRVDPRCLFTFDTSGASVRVCAAGELEETLKQWPNHLNLLCCIIYHLIDWWVDGWYSDIYVCIYAYIVPHLAQVGSAVTQAWCAYVYHAPILC